jgi:hypothetical protein
LLKKKHFLFLSFMNLQNKTFKKIISIYN